jgi:hypothetical protein
MPRFSLAKGWNRSSALSPEAIGAINTATTRAFDSALQKFAKTPEFANLDESQRSESTRIIAEKVTEQIAHFVEALKN